MNISAPLVKNYDKYYHDTTKIQIRTKTPKNSEKKSRSMNIKFIDQYI